MGVTHKVHTVDPVFFRALARAPRLVDWWLGYEECDLGLSASDFAAHPEVVRLAGSEGLGTAVSTDDGRELDRALPAIVCLLTKAFPDEPEAWATLEEKGSEEFPVVSLGPHGWGLDVIATRRLAGLLAVMGSFQVLKQFDPDLLTLLDVYPGDWHAGGSRSEVEQAWGQLERTLDDAAEKGLAFVVMVNL